MKPYLRASRCLAKWAGATAGQTLSAYVWQEPRFRWLRIVIDSVCAVFGQPDHCRRSHEKESSMEDKVTLALSVPVVNYVLQVLAQQPYKDVAAIIADIEAQGKAQLENKHG